VLAPVAALLHRLHAEFVKEAVRARTAGLHPHFVQPQDVGIGVPVRHFAHLVERIHEALKLLAAMQRPDMERCIVSASEL